MWSLKWDGSPQSEHDGTNFSELVDWTDVVQVDVGSFASFSSFGEDSQGNLYIVSVNGDIFRVTSATLGDTLFTAESFEINRGTLVGGKLSDTYASDDQYMCFNAEALQLPEEAPVWIIFDGTLSTDDPATLQLLLESQASTPVLTMTVEAWNWTTKSYDIVGAVEETVNLDSVQTFDLSGNVNDYVHNGSGAVRTRIGWRSISPAIMFPWEIKIDQMAWTTN